MKKPFLLYTATIVALTFGSCDPDPSLPNQEEVITTVIVMLTPTAGGDNRQLRFTDLDGEGGNAPTIKGDTLSISSTYNAKVQFLNQSGSLNEDITLEVLEQAADHQVFYASSVPEWLQFAYKDKDKNGLPIGVDGILTTLAKKGSGLLKLTLVHQPNKSGANVASGDQTNAGGETDIEVSFPVITK